MSSITEAMIRAALTDTTYRTNVLSRIDRGAEEKNPNACWFWNGRKAGEYTPVVGVGPSTTTAIRVVWVLFDPTGEQPIDGKTLRCQCGNTPLCINPGHYSPHTMQRCGPRRVDPMDHLRAEGYEPIPMPLPLPRPVRADVAILPSRMTMPRASDAEFRELLERDDVSKVQFPGGPHLFTPWGHFSGDTMDDVIGRALRERESAESVTSMPSIPRSA